MLLHSHVTRVDCHCFFHLRRVLAFEPVPLFHAFIAYGAAINNFSHLITVHRSAAGDGSGGSSLLPVGVPKDGTYWGLASVNNLNLHAHEGELTW